MEKQYTVKDLTSVANISEQGLRKFLNKNASVVSMHSTKTASHARLYDQFVYDMIVERYGKSMSSDDCETSETNVSQPVAEVSEPVVSENETVIAELKQEIEEMKGELKEKDRQLAEKEESLKEMIRQNGALLLLIQQEKMEKQKLLPAPKKTFLESVRSVFSKHPQQDRND